MHTDAYAPYPSIDSAIVALSRAFEQELRDDMSPRDYIRAINANRTEANPNVCHTHDYIDANESMIAAFRFTFSREINAASDDDAYLCNAAWSAWRTRSLYR